MNHLDIVQRIHDAEPAYTWQSADGMLGFVLRVIAALPATEKAGLVKAPPGGENVARYGDESVRVNRVIYPDGRIIKILTNSGVGGANGPAWNADDTRPDLYMPVDAADVDPVVDPPSPGGVTLASLAADVQRLQADRDALIAKVAEQAQQIEGFADRLYDLEQRPAPTAPKFELPELYVEGSTGRSFGHAHPVRLRVVMKGEKA